MPVTMTTTEDGSRPFFERWLRTHALMTATIAPTMRSATATSDTGIAASDRETSVFTRHWNTSKAQKLEISATTATAYAIDCTASDSGRVMPSAHSLCCLTSRFWRAEGGAHSRRFASIV